MSGPRIGTIAPNIPFLDSLASWWLQEAGDDPLALADGLFIVPTRRAARGLAEAFLAQGGGRPLLLPRIVPLGGLGEQGLVMAGALSVKPAVPPALRLAVLTRFVLAMGGRHGAPRSADRAWLLAAELASLLDEAARAEIDLVAALPGAAGENFAEHWNVTLEFLGIVTREWPGWLASEELSDVAARQIALLDAQAAAWVLAPPATPVIAAGSTGAIPAVARLLRVVAHLPQGLVMLPGLDLELDDEAWAALDDTHPQASLRALLAALGATRGDVFAATGHAAAAPEGRVAAWRHALLPASSLAAWRSPAAMDVSGLQRLAPADEQEEAVCVALALRQALEVPGTRAALVTPDRVLAQRVAAELLRFGVVADDSAGEPLAETPPAAFLRLLAEAVAEDLRPVPLLAFLKHPFAAGGLAPAAFRAAARRLEMQCLRGARPGPGLDGLRARQGDALFLDRLAGCLRPLLELLETPSVSPDRALLALIESAELLAATDKEPGAAILWAGEDGEALAAHLTELGQALPLLPAQELARLPPLLEATLAGQAVRSRRALRGRDGAEHPRVAIWGLLEARLQAADVIVLGGLAEGVWPPATDAGPWMNRAMRAAIGLPSPEERVGLAAHDFVMACCAAPVAILSAPRRRERAPCVPARWLVRLDALLAAQGSVLEMHPAPVWAGALDRPQGAPLPVAPPSPRPPVARRPRRLSVTEIETWLRDPYAIYAKHVLGLKKLDPIEESADAADYGSIVHDGMKRFFARFGTSWPADALEQLTAAMDAALDAAEMRPALSAWWRPRLRRIAAWVEVAERDRRVSPPLRIASELRGEWILEAPAGPFTLRCQADRIESLADDSVAILDYKTGAPPSARAMEQGLAPQLPLEAVMARAGAFGEDFSREVAQLTYWKISGGAEPGEITVLFKNDRAVIAERVGEAEAGLRALVAAFDDVARAYLCRPGPGAAPRFSDYAQLARVAEWQAAEDGV